MNDPNKSSNTAATVIIVLLLGSVLLCGGCIVAVFTLPGLIFWQVAKNFDPQAFEPPPPAMRVEMESPPLLDAEQRPADPLEPTANAEPMPSTDPDGNPVPMPVPAEENFLEPPPPGPVRPFKTAPFTNEPLTIAEGTSLDDAWQKFVDHFGEDRVVRVIFKNKAPTQLGDDGKDVENPLPPHTADWLKRLMQRHVLPGFNGSTFAAGDGKTVTGFVGPVRNVERLHYSILPASLLARDRKLDYARRTSRIEILPMEVPPAADSTEETEAIAELVKTITSEEHNSADWREAYERLAVMQSPAAAEAMVQAVLAQLPTEKGKKKWWVDDHLAILHRFTATKLVEVYQANETKPDAVLLLSFLNDIGDERTIPLLEPYLKPGEETTDQRAKLADEAITAINARLTHIKEKEERAQAEAPLPPLEPTAMNVLGAFRIRELDHMIHWDSSAVREKYARNWIEITGRLSEMQYVINKPRLYLETDGYGFSVDPNDPYGFSGLAPGQTLKLKCGLDGFLNLVQAEVLQSEGPPPIKATPAQLAARYADPAKVHDNLKKDRGRWVQMTGTICKLEDDSADADVVTFDMFRQFLETGTDLKVQISTRAFRVEAFEALQVGDELSILGKIEDCRHDLDPPRVIIKDYMLCAEPRVLKKEKAGDEKEQ